MSLDEFAPLAGKDEDLFRSPLCYFLLAGLGLFALRAFWEPGIEALPLQIQRSHLNQALADYERGIRREATAEERLAIERQFIDDALWLSRARTLGLAHQDPVVQQRLLLNMRFLDPGDSMSEAERLREAFELGLDRSDPVVRRRLIDRVQALIRAGVRSRPPLETALRSYYQEESERSRVPTLLDLSHVYLSRDQHGTALVEEAARLLRDLIGGAMTPERAIQLGDPFLSGHRFQRATPNQITARLGSEFEARVANAPTARWLGPIKSPFGLHLVWIEQRIDSQVPPYQQVRTQVLEAWFREETRKALQREIEAHRRQVAVEIVGEDPPGLASTKRDGLN
jgi:hypothetical protein